MNLTQIQQAIIDAGQKFEGANVCFSTPYPLMMDLATSHSINMAKQRKQSHDGFIQRYAIMKGEIKDCNDFAEICAESWDRQANDTMLELGEEMFRCWKQSEGHWKVASMKHKYFGCNMKKGKNGIYYCCIIVGD
jgi:uncharacterized protein YkwD